MPYSILEEVFEFIAENKHCEENLLRAALEAENVDPETINGIICRTLDSTSIRSAIDAASMPLARWICKWLGDNWTSFLKTKQRKAKNENGTR